MNSFATAIIFLSDDLCYILLGKKCLLLTHALQSDSSSCSLAEGLQPYHVFFAGWSSESQEATPVYVDDESRIKSYCIWRYRKVKLYLIVIQTLVASGVLVLWFFFFAVFFLLFWDRDHCEAKNCLANIVCFLHRISCFSDNEFRWAGFVKWLPF